MTKIIAAYPCLGKTTLTNENKLDYFDREFNESRSTIGMTQQQKNKFYRLCVEMLELQYETDQYKVIFITEDDNIIVPLGEKLGYSNITVVFPNVFDPLVMINYKDRVIERSGLEWWNRVIEPELPTIKERIFDLQKLGFDLKFTGVGQYIENVVDLEKL